MDEGNFNIFSTHKHKPENDATIEKSNTNVMILDRTLIRPVSDSLAPPTLIEEGVFVMGANANEFKEEPEEYQEFLESELTENDTLKQRYEESDTESEGNEENLSITNDDIKIEEESDDSKSEEDEDNNDDDQDEVAEPKTSVKKDTPKKRNYKLKPSCPKTAYINYFKGLRPDYEKLTPERRKQYIKALIKTMKEHKNDETLQTES